VPADLQMLTPTSRLQLKQLLSHTATSLRLLVELLLSYSY
jgi:hypothetical protein